MLETNLRNLVTRLGTEFKAVRTLIGSLTDLNTTAKSSVVAALNGLQVKVTQLEQQLGNATGIDDNATAATTTWSSTKINSSINASITALIGGAPGTLDTLKELADALTAADSELDGLLAMINNRVRFDAAQVLDATQQAQARANIGAVAAASIGDTERDLVADFNAALL